MNEDRARSFRGWLVAAVVLLSVGCGPSSLRTVHYSNHFNEPVPEHDVVEGRPNVVVFVHGWTASPVFAYREGEARWNNPGLRTALNRLLESRGTAESWDIWGLDWNEGAAVPEGSSSKAMPCTANEINAQVQGQWIAKTLLDHHEYEHVHLIGHSLGGRVIETASAMIEQVMPDATIHTTFLDAYSAYTWDLVYGSTSDFSDHYFSSNDWMVQMTNESFPSALTVDISTITVPYDPNWEFGEQSWGHNAPVWFYRESCLEPDAARYRGYGAPLGREFLGETWPSTRDEAAAGQLVTIVMGDEPTRAVVPPAEALADRAYQPAIVSDSSIDTFGTVDITAERVALTGTTEEPVAWVIFEFETTEDTNFFELDFHWVDTRGEGRAMFFVDGEALWGTESQVSLDRWASTGTIMWTGMLARIPLETALDAGTHELAFRLDRFVGGDLSIEVRDVRGGMLVAAETAVD